MSGSSSLVPNARLSFFDSILAFATDSRVVVAVRVERGPSGSNSGDGWQQVTRRVGYPGRGRCGIEVDADIEVPYAIGQRMFVEFREG